MALQRKKKIKFVDLYKINKIYEIVNGLSKYKVVSKGDEHALCLALRILIRVIEPMIPHLAEECWSLGKNNTSIMHTPWPTVDKSFIEKNEVVVVIQINGKRRAEINIEKGASEDDVFNKVKNIYVIIIDNIYLMYFNF